MQELVEKTNTNRAKILWTLGAQRYKGSIVVASQGSTQLADREANFKGGGGDYQTQEIFYRHRLCQAL